MKLVKWVIAFVPTLLGILEGILKVLKELLTLVVDILFPVIPIKKFKDFVTWLRAKVDYLYDLLSQWKTKILKYVGLVN